MTNLFEATGVGLTLISIVCFALGGPSPNYPKGRSIVLTIGWTIFFTTFVLGLAKYHS